MWVPPLSAFVPLAPPPLKVTQSSLGWVSFRSLCFTLHTDKCVYVINIKLCIHAKPCHMCFCTYPISWTYLHICTYRNAPFILIVHKINVSELTYIFLVVVSYVCCLLWQCVKGIDDLSLRTRTCIIVDNFLEVQLLCHWANAPQFWMVLPEMLSQKSLSNYTPINTWWG